MRRERLKAVGCSSDSDPNSCNRRFLPTAYSLRPIACAIALTIALSGCAIEPWVKPYERAALADPIMAAARDAVSSEYLHHVHEVREGARGASGSAGGGCGCN